MGDFHTRGGIVAPVQVDGQVHMRSDGLANGVGLIDHDFQLSGRYGPVPSVRFVRIAGVVQVKFNGGKALGTGLFGALLAVGHGAVYIQAHAVAKLSAQEPVYRHALRFAGQVPQGDLQSRQSGDASSAIPPRKI